MIESKASLTPLRILARYAWRYRWRHALLLVAVFGAVACSLGSQVSIGNVVDAVAAGPDGGNRIWYAVAIFTFLVGGDNLLWRVVGWCAARTFPNVGVDLRLELFGHLLRHSAGYFGQRLAGGLANRVTTAAQAMFTVENTLAFNIIPPTVAIIGALVALTAVHWQLAAALSAVVLVLASGLSVAAQRGRPLHHIYAGRAADVGGAIVDVVSNHGAVRAFAAEDREYAALNAGLHAEAHAHRRALFHMEALRAVHAVGVWVLSSLMLGWAVLLWQHGVITPGQVVVVGSLSLGMLSASRDLAVALVETGHQWGRLADALREVTVPHDLPDRPGAAPIVVARGELGFREVAFGYAGEQPILHKLDLTIPAGQKVGIVGPSGAGKSTLLALLQRFYVPDTGRIEIDGMDIAACTQDSLRRAIAIVPQETWLFHRSILENIRYARPTADEAEVLAAARAARCDEFVQRMPNAYATPVGERGIRLSGGQRQRIGIARAILADAPIVLLDEATSALDSESERAIQHALAALMQGRTVLAIAHRLSMLIDFDRILVLDQGHIVEDGSPQALLKGEGAFARLWQLQAGAEPAAQRSPRPNWGGAAALPPMAFSRRS
ncbi:MAG: transporter [Rhodospirillales bacterium]|nr:transporter [Rhodospirillales bacterium]